MGDSKIAGYGRPNFDLVANTDSASSSADTSVNNNTTSQTSAAATTLVTSIAKEGYLQKGDSGESVKELQQKLIKLGYSIGSVDGKYGSLTYTAVISFQKSNSLEVDGVVGTETMNAVDGAISLLSGTTADTTIKAGSVVSIVSGATYYNGQNIPKWVSALKWNVASVSGDRAVLGKCATSKITLNSPINVKYLEVGSAANTVIAAASANSFAVGDIVNFTGNTHYLMASSARGSTCKSGKAKITSVYGGNNAKHPYHLVATSGSESDVHGWVNTEDIERV